MYSSEQLQILFGDYVQKAISSLGNTRPDTLYSPVQYALEDGGKRIRPVLLLMAYNIFAEDVESALPAALSLEIFHNFTLLHDDIMDNADVRRNRPTVHRKFGPNAAILSGDVMSFLSYKHLFEMNCQQTFSVAKLFTDTAIEVCEGQQMDMDFETRHNVTETEYLEMIRLKTAVLIACSLKAGVLLAGADEKTAAMFYELGINLGMAFQLQDDYLDTFGNQESFGKRIGGDILANKKTYLLIHALKTAQESLSSELNSWLEVEIFNPEEKIKEVTRIFSEAGVKEMVTEKINSYFEAMDFLFKALQVSDNKKLPLKLLASKMLKRNH